LKPNYDSIAYNLSMTSKDYNVPCASACSCPETKNETLLASAMLNWMVAVIT